VAARASMFNIGGDTGAMTVLTCPKARPGSAFSCPTAERSDPKDLPIDRPLWVLVRDDVRDDVVVAISADVQEHRLRAGWLAWRRGSGRPGRRALR